jgi:sulfoquinovose isomerase
MPGDRGSESHRAFLATEAGRLTPLTKAAALPGGFGWLDERCRVTGGEVHLWITARMTHVAGLAVLAGSALHARPEVDQADVLAHGVGALLDGPLHDSSNGGWFGRVGPAGVLDRDKQAYDHAFVVLAACTAAAAGAPGAEALLARALAVFDEHFWDAAAGMVVETWDSSFSILSDYRGMNANMHAVEALLAAHDVTGDGELLARAHAIAQRVVALARANGYRVPEHADADWNPLLDYNADRPADQFRPFGATIGHGLEWSRLLVQLDVARRATGAGETTSTWLADAQRLYDRSVADGWGVDGAPGFVYTTDWSGTPVVHERMHWVCCEAILAAAALAETTGDPRYEADYQRWWLFAQQYLVDSVHGSWRHELDLRNRPASSTWAGKPDLYHAVQACLLPSRHLSSSAVRALSDHG